jgi:hypothetical protein
VKGHPRRAVLAMAIATSVAVLSAVTAAFAAAGSMSPWAWSVGDDQGGVGVSRNTGVMEINSASDLDVTAQHLRLVTADGNYEFEHGVDTPETLLNSYFLGTPNRTPIAVGGYADGEDVVSLIVRGIQGQRHDLQQWETSGNVAAAIDGRGRLRLGQVALTTRIVKGKAQLVAVLPGGTQQVLAAAR